MGPAEVSAACGVPPGIGAGGDAEPLRSCRMPGPPTWHPTVRTRSVAPAEMGLDRRTLFEQSHRCRESAGVTYV